MTIVLLQNVRYIQEADVTKREEEEYPRPLRAVLFLFFMSTAAYEAFCKRLESYVCLEPQFAIVRLSEIAVVYIVELRLEH